MNPEAIPVEIANKIIETVHKIANRAILPVLDEVNQPDRQALDDAVLEAIGFNDLEERGKVLEEMYDAVCQRVESRFERARSAQHPGEKRSRPNPEAIAEELYKELTPESLRKFPDDFVSSEINSKSVALPEVIDDFERVTFNRLRVGSNFMEFENPDEAEFIQFALQAGASASILIPTEPSLIHDAVSSYRGYLSELAKHLEELASSRTQDRKLKQRIIEALRQKLGLHTIQADNTARLF